MNLNEPDQEKEGADEGGRQNKDTNKLARILGCALAPAERMERFVRVPYGLYQGYGNTVPLGQPGLSGHKQPDWRQNMGPPTFLARPGLLVPANAPDYCMDPYKRAQLKAILSQMNPSLSPRLCKPNTKEVGVQVSPRVDKAVQCSLGPRTLSSCSPWDGRDPREALPACGVTSPGTGRRSLIRLRRDGDHAESKALPGPEEASQPQPSPPRSEADRPEKPGQPEESGEKDALCPQETKSKQVPGDAAKEPLRRPNFQVDPLFPLLSPRPAPSSPSFSIYGGNKSKIFSLFFHVLGEGEGALKICISRGLYVW